MIVSKNIGYVQRMDNAEAAPELNGNYTGLSAVDFSIIPHFTDFPFKKIAKQILEAYESTMDMIPISNNQVVTVKDSTIETLTAPDRKKQTGVKH